MQRHPAELHKLIKSLWIEICNDGDCGEFYKSVKKLLRGDRLNEVQHAAAFYLCSRIGYSGITVRNVGMNVRSAHKNLTHLLIDTIPYWCQILDGVKITSRDYRVVMKEVSKESALFIDSPYETVDGGPNIDFYFCRPWRQPDFFELADHLSQIDRRGVRWVVTLMLSPETEKLFIEKLRNKCNTLRYGKLPVTHCIAHKKSEELLLWNFCET
jgi:site-specific DNA-adenine methylase